MGVVLVIRDKDGRVLGGGGAGCAGVQELSF